MEAVASALGALVLLAAIALLLSVGRKAGAGPLAAVLAAGLAVAVALGARGAGAPPRPEGPPALLRGGYAGSAACKPCHPGEHASWERSFHRTMTQRPSRQTVRAPWEGVVGDGPRRLELSTRAGALWVGCPSPEQEAARLLGGGAQSGEVERVERPLALVTGSHHYQVYWVSGASGELRPLPWVWLIDDGAWIPREAAFLQPEGAEHLARWNSGCIQCHAVGGRPRHDAADERFRTDVVELGIACEACHGPGAEHAALLRSPVARHRARGPGGEKGPMVLPTALEPTRGAEVCGQCHSMFLPKDPARFWEDGMGYRPGQPLGATHAGRASGAQLEALLGAVGQTVDDVTWPGGAVRVGGREWDGMTASACYQRGEGERRLVCTSCHAMHDAAPDDQLRRDAHGDASCLGCHEDLRADPAKHTRHEPGSEGSRCMGCHMPYTSYALLKGIRTHRVASPLVRPLYDAAERGNEPNACSLCHLDKTLRWASDELARWPGARPAPALNPLEETVAAGVLWAVAGDAAQRALVAFAMGQHPSARWQVPYLADLLVDPYPAVRKVAERALRRSGVGLDYDFLAELPAREAARARLWALVAREGATGRPTDPASLLWNAGARDDARYATVRAARRDRPIVIAE